MQLMTKDNWTQTFNDLVNAYDDRNKPVLIISPFLSNVAIRYFSILRNKNIKCQLITRLNKLDFWQGSSSPVVLLQLIDMGVQVKTLRGLHAKAYFFGDCGIVTSANFTANGIRLNYEMGILFKRNDNFETLSPFDEANNLWDRQRVLSRERIINIIEEMSEFAERTPSFRIPLNEEDLTDEGEELNVNNVDNVPAVYENILINHRNNNEIPGLITAFRESHDQVDANGHITRLEKELADPNNLSISLQSYLWLLGWCNTDPFSRGRAMEAARRLATFLFGYVPEKDLKLGSGVTCNLKDLRNVNPIPIAAEIIAMHEEKRAMIEDNIFGAI